LGVTIAEDEREHDHAVPDSLEEEMSSKLLHNFARATFVALIVGGALSGCAEGSPDAATALSCGGTSSEFSGGSGPVDCVRANRANAAIANANETAAPVVAERMPQPPLPTR
jgi:hypothetical protein